MEDIRILIGLAVAAIAFLIFLVIWFSTLARIKQLRGQVNLTIGALRAQYEQRFDLLPDIQRSARQAERAQRGYLDKMLEVRSGLQHAASTADLGAVSGELAPMIIAASAAAASRPVTESNPAMSIEADVQMQRALEQTEKDVAAARRFYWSAVTDYNVAIHTFPTSIVAAIHGYREIAEAQITPQLETKPDYFLPASDRIQVEPSIQRSTLCCSKNNAENNLLADPQ